MSKSLEQKHKLYSQLSTCEKVKKTVKSKGWKEILGPKLQKMIDCVMGQQDSNGLYLPGLMDKDKGEKQQYYLGYKAALMDFNNEVYGHLASINKIRDSIKTIEDTGKKENVYTEPMKDTKYA